MSSKLNSSWNSKVITTIEKNCQLSWDNLNTYKTNLSQKERPTFYCLVMFPYPSGRIHMGHVRNYVIGDVISRYKRLQGFSVFQPIGWDSFGLPAENAAIINNTPPAEWTYKNIATMKDQLKKLGISYDWTSEIYTCKPEYYRWNQFIFLKMLEKGLAYRKKSKVNWCSKCSTVLANEQVIDNYCWRHPEQEVESKELKQWFLRITDKAENLLNGHKQLKNKWPNRVLSMQKTWIGQSEGVELKFKLQSDKANDFYIQVFTTRLDTLMGVTCLAVAPEHPLLEQITNNHDLDNIKKLQKQISQMTDIDRESAQKKIGCFTGLCVLHPITNEKIPIYIASFVLMHYGTGAVMSVPAHDQRDYEFAKKYDLPVKQVIIDTSTNDTSLSSSLPLMEAYIQKGTLINSGEFNGLSSNKAIEKMVDKLSQKNLATRKKNYRLKDWLISRQRYWGTPIPVIYCPQCGCIPVKESDLPVILPEQVNFQKTDNPLKFIKEFYQTTCPSCGHEATRETDTMDTFLDSSWYFLRYLSPQYDKSLVNPQHLYFMPVNQYIGGIEHATMHLLYARYMTHILHDFNIVNFEEPFSNLLTQGMVIKDGKKMSKSLGNIIDPDSLIEKYGTDTIRLFSMFAAPVEKDLDWSDDGVMGCFKFLGRLYRFITHYQSQLEFISTDTTLEKKKLASFSQSSQKLLQATHIMIKKITHDLEVQGFNKAVARIMEFTNTLYHLFPLEENIPLLKSNSQALSNAISGLLVVIYPFAPHFAWHFIQQLGFTNERELKWPQYSKELTVADTMKIVCQVNGKLRGSFDFNTNTSKEEILDIIKSDEHIQKYIQSKNIIKEIYIPQRLVNIVIKN